MVKKMYVIQADDGLFFCGMRYWDKQLRKAKIYHSLTYAKDVVEAYKECNCKIVEVSLGIVQKPITNADRIRAMSDEELGMFVLAAHLGYKCWCNFHCENEGDGGCDKCIAEWLKQPAEEESG